MTDFVLVPGAWHGGWWYEPVVEALQGKSHRAHPVTLAGLAPDTDTGRGTGRDTGRDTGTDAGPVTLDTHIDQLAALVERVAGAGRVVLVGHSYGGMVVTAVADRLPDLVRAVVLLDADLPDDGESSWSLAPPEVRDPLIDGAGDDGLTVAPLPFFDDRARPHPLATLIQRVRLTGAWKQVPVKVYIAALDTPGGLQASGSMAKVRNDPAWWYEEWHTSHDVLRDGPDRVVDLLLSV